MGTAPETQLDQEHFEARQQLAGLVTAAHPKQALVTGLVLAGAAYSSGRPVGESLVAGAAVLVVQVVLGLVNDAGDRERDRSSGVAGKPVADGRLPAGNASFVAVCLVLVAIPLSLQNGSAAAAALLGFLLAGLASRTPLRRSPLSWLPWAVSYAFLPAFLSYGGSGLGVHGGPPTAAMTGLAALLGVAVHFLTALPDLVADNKTGIRHLPLRLALRTGAPRLLALSTAYAIVVAVAVLVAGFTVGLRH